MAVAFSDYLENKVLDHVLGKAAYTSPTAYVALLTAAPSDAGGGTEVSGGAYARLVTAATDWNSAAAGSISNATALTFTTATANWGTVTHYAIYDAATAGNLLIWGVLNVSKTINNGDTAKFDIGQLSGTLD